MSIRPFGPSTAAALNACVRELNENPAYQPLVELLQSGEVGSGLLYAMTQLGACVTTLMFSDNSPQAEQELKGALSRCAATLLILYARVPSTVETATTTAV